MGKEVTSAKPWDGSELKPLVKGLQNYANSLAAVTNAADREALNTAQAELKLSVESLPGRPAISTQAVGPFIGLFNFIIMAILDSRRYEDLKIGVLAAKEPVATLGDSLGNMLEEMWKAQVGQLQRTVDQLNLKLQDNDGQRLSVGEYASRLDALQSTVAALEIARTSKPKKVAADMVDAHNELAEALQNNQGQAEAVIKATSTFLDRAKDFSAVVVATEKAK